MRVKPCIVLACTVMLVSCASVNPFTHDNPYIASAGADEGEYVFTATEDFSSVVGLDFPGGINITRVSGVINYETGRFYGALEGSFKKNIAQTALRMSGAFRHIKYGHSDYFVSEDGIAEIIVAADGLLLFASSGITDVYERTYLKRETTLSREITEKLVSSDAGFYVDSPKFIPDMGIDLNAEAFDRFDYILSTASGGTYSVSFGMKSEEFAHSLLKIIRAAVVTQIRASGQKPDMGLLKNTIREEGSVVYVTEQKYNGPYLCNFVLTER